MKTLLLPSMLTLLLPFGACGGKPTQPQPSGGPPAPANTGGAPQDPKKTSDHGASLPLGTVAVGTRQFDVVRLGELVQGKEGAFEVIPKNVPADQFATLNGYLWLESQDGTQVSAPEKGGREGNKWHFHATPQPGDKKPFRVVLRVRTEGADERGSLPLDGHGHEHVEGPHHGVPAKFTGGGATGHLELKLHDDKGDLELWLYEDDKMTKPFDLPLASTVAIEFVDKAGKKVTLRPRNADKNEDEDGKPNVRDGKTNYFIFPGAGGEDASWLQGKQFQSIAVVRFQREQTAFASEELMLKPHVH
jgi:hypothetical protein